MNHGLMHIAAIIGFAIGSVASTVFAQTTANGPYYATPSWDQQLPASTRFIVLSNWGNAAVLDRETGLVWEQSPSATLSNWYAQSFHCLNLYMGGRTGWRLPTIQELLSLVDRSASNPTLPSGHPFSNAMNFYWSATTFEYPDSGGAWGANLNAGGVVGTDKSNSTARAWCVRGGSGGDSQ